MNNLVEPQNDLCKPITVADLKSMKRWVSYRILPAKEGKKPRKLPISAVTGNGKEWNLSKHHATFSKATEFARLDASDSRRTGCGLVLGNGLVGIDLDDCIYIDATGARKVKSWATDIMDAVQPRPTFAEYSVSKTGIHIYLLSDWRGEDVWHDQPTTLLPDGTVDPDSGGRIEVYAGNDADGGGSSRYFIWTGKKAGDSTPDVIASSSELLVAVLAITDRQDRAAGTTLLLPSAPAVQLVSQVLTGLPDAFNSEADEDALALLPSFVRPETKPYYLLNRLAVFGADTWFPALFFEAKKSGDTWRGTTPGASRGDISLHPTGMRWWKSTDPITPIDAVAQFGEMTVPEAVAWLMEMIGIDATALRGLATVAAKSTASPPDDIFSDGTNVALPWVPGTLPEVLENYAECMAHELGVNQSCLALLFLMTCGASIPGGIRFQPDPAKPGWVVPATSWTVILAGSGMSKSPGIDVAMKPVYDVHDRWKVDHATKIRNASDDKEKERLRKAGPKRRVTNGSTTEALLKLMGGQPEGIIMHADEIAGAFDAIGKYNKGSQGGASDSQVLLQMYESKSFNLDRKDENRSVAVERAHGSLIGGVQPAVLAGMAGSLTGNGMLQRAIIAVMTVGLYGQPCDDADGRETYHHVVTSILRLGDWASAEMLIVGSADVGMAMIEEGNRARLMMLNDPTLSDAAKSVLGKTTGHIARIALFLHLIDWALLNRDEVDVLGNDPIAVASEVGIETMRRAVNLWWGYCWPTMLQVYDGAGLTASTLADARHVAVHILNRPEKYMQTFTSRSFKDVRKFAGKEGMSRLFGALDELVERRWLKIAERQTNGAPIYSVDERVWSLFADKAATLQARWAA